MKKLHIQPLSSSIKPFFRHLLLCLIILMTVTSCDDRKEVSIGISQCSSDDWRSKMNDELLLELSQHPEVEAEILSAEDSNEKQIEDIRHFIDSDVDVLIVSPREAEAITPVIEEARKKGIKVLTFDRETVGESYDNFYGADNHAIGMGVARYLKKRRQERGSFAPLEILEVRGLDESTPTRGRHSGFMEELGGDTDIHLVASISSDWTDGPTERMVDSVLRLHPEINTIYAHNDRMGLAARKAADKLGRRDIFIIGIDAAPSIGLAGVESGQLDATFLYPTEGGKLLRQAIGMARGESYPRRQISQTVMPVDSTNVRLMRFSSEALSESVEQAKGLSSRIASFSRSKNLMQTLLWVGFGLLVIAAGVLFLILRLYWARQRSQGQLAASNEELRRQKDDLSHLNDKLKSQTEELRNLNSQLNEATTSKLTFFTNVSHDLRTPLTLISAPVEALKESSSLTVNEKALLDIAAKNIRILKRLINQILDFQKFDSGKLRLELSRFDIIGAVREWADSFRSPARQKDIRLTLEIVPQQMDGENLPVTADREKLERVFFNLMSNAFRFTPPNGGITIRLDLSNPDNIHLSIADTGKGIPSDMVPHLFERFFQGREGKAGGSGIGLAVVKSFVELHGGSVGVESAEGRGAVFSFEIPRVCGEPVREEVVSGNEELEKEVQIETSSVELPPEEEPDATKPTLLVVDDNEDIRLLLRGLLSDRWQVLTAPDGESAIRLANRYVPDCIVCDVMMPGIDGLEVTRRLKSDSITNHIPILLLTACALDEQRADGYESGADAYLPKPFDRRVLLSRVESLLANRRRIEERFREVTTASESGKGKKAAAPEKRVSADPFSELDSRFYRDFVAMVEKDMGDPELSVEEMASRMGMSRVQLYRKMKALTNYSPADLLRLFRLRRAKEILASSDALTVAEVAYQVGFSSPSYFSKCFREQFGELPSDWQGRTSRIS